MSPSSLSEPSQETASPETITPNFLAGGGEMGARMRAFDWASTPLGSPESWPQSLKTIVRVMLDSRYAMWMLWGPEYTFFCNDAYLPTVGIRRDWVLGERSDIVWEEVWSEAILPRLERVLNHGEATWDEGLLLFLERSGFSEETYHTFSYSPIYDDNSHIAGMLCVVTEVTDRVIGERRLHLLRDLSARASVAETIEQCCERLFEVLGNYPYDIAFAATYIFDKNEIDKDIVTARCTARSSVLDTQLFPPVLTANSQSLWPIDKLVDSTSVLEIDLPASGIDLHSSLWPDRLSTALMIPLTDTAQDRVTGFVVIGTSPRRQLDDAYRSFLNLIANQIGSTIANVEAYEAERSRTQALAELDQAKTVFFSNVSHEFRTPLTLMLGPIETLLADKNIALEVKEQLELTHRNSLRLLKLVNSLLDFSRIEAGRMNANYEPVDLAAFTRDVASAFRSTMEAAGLDFIVNCDLLLQPIYVDREMWEKIILNLLSNAFKFTLQGSIQVRLYENSNKAVLEIEDTGVGISDEELPKLFDRFHRVEKTEARTHEGSGIGLALVRELVALNGATINVTSQLGKGSLFRVEVPFGHQHLSADKVSIASTPTSSQHANAFVEEAFRWLPDKSARSGSSQSNSPSQNNSIRTHDRAQADRRFAQTFGLRILVADDNADMRAYLHSLLSPVYAVETVVDGMEALAAARRHLPDLILSDVMMPRLDGFGLLATLRADEQLRDVPVILLSARAGEDSRIEGFDAGADDYLAKPFSAREMLTRVGALLELTHMRHEDEAKLRLALSSIQDQFYVLDDKWCYVLLNQRAAAITGKSENELIGNSIFDTNPQLRVSLFETELLNTARNGTLRHFEYFDATRERWFEYRLYPAREYGVAVLVTDTTDRKHAQELALLRQEQLEAADRQKNQFLAMLAHELRNPLAPLGNASELLTHLVEPDSAAQSAIGMIKRQVFHLTRLVDDLLDVSRITQGRVELQLENVDMAQVITQALETVEPLLRTKNQNIIMNATYALPMRVEGDLTRLIQCLVNILTNAVKYTDQGGEIVLNAHADGGFAVIQISDNGVGIPAELLPHVFDLFVQGERTLDRSLGGLGIGLSVVKGLVEMHGGTVKVFSPGLNQGSTFIIELPLSHKAGSTILKPELIDSISKNILVVDDNADAANSLAALLTLAGHSAHTAFSGREALQHAETFKLDIAILDIGLPEMDGYELARELRKIPHLQQIKLVALTGYGQADDRERARQAGFDEHLLKPIDFERLRITLETL